MVYHTEHGPNEANELSQELRKENYYVKDKGYKTISKLLGVLVTDAYIFQEFNVQHTVASLFGCGCKRETDDKLKRPIEMVTKETRITSKVMKGELQGQGTSVSDPTICQNQSQREHKTTQEGHQIIKM